VGPGQPPHRDREDVAGAAVRVAPRLLVDLEQHPSRLAAGVVLNVCDQHLLRLGGGEAGEALELPALDPLLALQLVGAAVEVAFAIGECLLAALEVGELEAGGFSIVERPLLEPRDFLATGAKVGGAVARGVPCTACGLDG
jgi:hypothetical protein